MPQLVCRLAASQFDRGRRAVAGREDGLVQGEIMSR